MSIVDGGHVIMNESMMVSVTDNEVDDIVMSEYQCGYDE